MGEAPAPAVGTEAIRSYHAHIYFTSPDERATALALRAPIAERYVVTLGRVHDVPIGPHGAPMYQVAFAIEVFPGLVPFLMLERRGLSVLVHPNTGRALDDHVHHALWLGQPIAVRADTLTNGPD
jgi:DOPA 4,5-dioxygenase